MLGYLAVFFCPPSLHLDAPFLLQCLLESSLPGLQGRTRDTQANKSFVAAKYIRQNCEPSASDRLRTSTQEIRLTRPASSQIVRSWIPWSTFMLLKSALNMPFSQVISRASERLALAYIGPEYRELMAIRKMSNDITASELDREGNFLSDQAERLRRVLEYILRMDYGMEPFADCLNLCDYRIIAGHINDMQLRHALNLDWVPWCEKIKITVVDPAIELGLPAYVALRMLNRFAVNHTDDQKYGGCHDYIRQRWGPSCLGRKVDTDLHVTIAAIVPWCKEKTRSELWKRADALLDELSLSDDETQSKAGEADEASVAEEQERRTADDVCTTCPSEVSPPPDFYDKRGVLRGLWTGVKALFTAPGPRPKRRGLTRMEVEERGGMVLALDPRITSRDC